MNRYQRIHAGRCLEIEGSPRFRSAWERNIYRVLLLLHKTATVEYEPKRYPFPEPYRRHLDYLPDFRIGVGTEGEHLVEVKGELDGASRSRLRGFKKYYAREARRMVVVTKRENHLWLIAEIGCKVWDYKQIEREIAGLVHWEGR